MKKLLCLLTLVLAGCSQEYLDQKAAERDDAYCVSIGISGTDPNYYDCRRYAAYLRMEEARNHAATAGMLLGYSAAINNQQRPVAPAPAVTCVQQGVFTTCQ